MDPVGRRVRRSLEAIDTTKSGWLQSMALKTLHAFGRRPSSAEDPKAYSGIVAPTLALLIVVGVWELFCRTSGLPPYLVPSPSAIAVEIVERRALLADHALTTLVETVVGLLLASVLGIGLAMLVVSFKRLGEAIYPLLVVSQVVPKVAIAPLLIVYVGFGIQSKILIAFLLAIFPMVVNTVLGFRTINPELLQLLATLKASKWQVMWKIRTPNAVPHMIEGAKIAVTLAVIGAIVGEFASGDRGLGFLISSSSSALDTVLSFAAIVVLAALGIGLFKIVEIVGNALTPRPLRPRS